MLTPYDTFNECDPDESFSLMVILVVYCVGDRDPTTHVQCLVETECTHRNLFSLFTKPEWGFHIGNSNDIWVIDWQIVA